VPDYLVEVLVDGQPTTVESIDENFDLEVEVGQVYSEGIVLDIAQVEIYTVPPNPDALIEPYIFSHGGNLVVQVGGHPLPITDGTFAIESIAARLGVAPTGSSAILDVNKNGTSVFVSAGDRPTIIDGGTVATVGSWNNVTYTTGDYLSIDIDQVGSAVTGANLVVVIRLRKIA
jgi:hypothetical protein